VRDHAPVIYKAADVIGGLSADNIRSFMKVPRVIAHGHFVPENRTFRELARSGAD
jgi:hypothetical protein